MKFSVEAWAPEYGVPSGADLTPASGTVNLDVEVPVLRWAARRPPDGPPPPVVLFTDGVRRVDARVWIEGDEGTRPGVCASYAAGAVRVDGRATVAAASVKRAVFTTVAGADPIVTKHGVYPPRMPPGDAPEQLWQAVQDRMGELEAEVAAGVDGDLVVIDGPLSGRRNLPHAVGYVKTHHVAYLPPVVDGVVAALGEGERTPLFLTGGPWGRFSWYLRLPGGGRHAWAGIVRCEASGDMEVAEAVARADQVARLLPRFASAAHKDPRAPQNLYPIAGLERELRRRLGDPMLLYRALRRAAAG